MAFNILNPKFIDDGAGGFDDWTVGSNGAWQPADLGTDDHGANGVYLSPGTGTDNMIFQAGVFPDFGLGIQHKVTVVVNQYLGGSGIKVRFGTALVGTITSVGNHTFQAAATGDDTLSLEVMAGTLVEVDRVIAADIIAVGEPQELTPAYNPSVWYLTSINNNKPGYRYLVEVYDTSNSLVATYRYTPAIGTGYAVADLTRILKNFVSTDVNTTQTQRVPNSWFGYYIKAYDEFSVPFVYDDYDVVLDTYTALTAASNTHNFNVGDLVNVAQTDGGTLKPMLQGVHTVVTPTVAGTTDLYIDVLALTTGPGTTMGGSVIYADDRKTTSNVLYTSDIHYVFNGSLAFVPFKSYDMNDYVMATGDSSTEFLTSMPRNAFYVYDTQDFRLNFANYFLADPTVHFLNDGGDEFTITTSSQSAQALLGVNAGPQTTMSATVSGTAPLVKPDTLYYDVWVQDGGSKISEMIRIYIDRRCRIDNYEMLFMDRMGSMLSYTFQLRSKETQNNTKSTFKRLPGGYGVTSTGDPGYVYATTDRGEQTYNVNFDRGLQLQTDWMNDEMSVYFAELVSSPITYLKVDTDTYESVIVNTANMVVERQKNKRLIRYTIDVKFSNNQDINI